MDNLKVAKEARLTTLRDKWLITCGKPTSETKAWMKKATEAEKKKAERENKAREKAKKKSQAIDIRRLAINNSQRVVETFKVILSDPSTGPKAFNDAVSDLLGPEASNNAVQDLPGLEAFNNAIPDLPGPDSSSSTLKSLFGNNARLSNSQKKKAT